MSNTIQRVQKAAHVLKKHHGPGNHKDGSSQKVHGGDDSTSAQPEERTFWGEAASGRKVQMTVRVGEVVRGYLGNQYVKGILRGFGEKDGYEIVSVDLLENAQGQPRRWMYLDQLDSSSTPL